MTYEELILKLKDRLAADGAYPIQAQAVLSTQILKDKLELVLPWAMEASGFDFWLVLSRENNDDPIHSTLVTWDMLEARRVSILAFHRDSKTGAVRRMCVGSQSPEMDGLYENVQQRGESVWKATARILRECDPSRIAVNRSINSGYCDGLTATLLEQLKDAINALLHRLRRSEEEQLNQQLMQDARWAREPAENMPELDDIPENGLVGTSAAMQDLRANILKAAPTMADVLVIGETGTGKELVSAAIHQASPRANGPFITINCGALDENLLMDTLFGHVKGAFTEARQPRKGAFLTAEGGTLMLDEIGNAAPKVQQALLRALSTRMIRPLGSDEDVPFDTRIIAATNAELLQDAQEGSFREDLYYRLAVITIRTPPLRRRKSDLPLLAVFFLTRAAESQGLPTPRLSRGALRKLQEYHWPGNVRELQNCLTRALAFCENGLIFAENIQLGPDTLPGDIARPERGKLSCPPARADSRQPHGEAAETAESPVAQPVPAESEDQGAMPVAEDAQPRLNARLARLLPQIVELGSISRQEYQDMAGKDISMRTAQYDLQILVRLGLVRREGRGPAQRYIVLPAARGFRA